MRTELTTRPHLSSLPTELRLQIYGWMPELQPKVPIYVTPSHSRALTPAICRANRLLRCETLPIYAARSVFHIDISSITESGRERVGVWLEALGSEVKRLRDIRLSRAWDIAQPSRGSGHVGFYLNLTCCDPHELCADEKSLDKKSQWYCRHGTYPMVKDLRGMRFESVELLQRYVLAYICTRQQCQGKSGVMNESEHGGKDSTSALHLQSGDIEVIIRLMDVVAGHPFSLYNTGCAHVRQRIWESMQRRLRLVAGTCPEGTEIATAQGNR